MYKKLLCILITITVLVPQFVFPTHATEVLWTFYVTDSNGYGISASDAIEIRGQNNINFEESLINGVATVSLTPGSIISYNIRIDGYDTFVSPYTYYVETVNENIYITLTSASVYAQYGYTRPLTTQNVTSNFGWRAFTSGGTYYYNRHDGVDYSASSGTPIYSICDVNLSTFSTGYEDNKGYYVEYYSSLGHFVEYMHLNSEFDVLDIAEINQGDVTGFTGNTGNSTGPHLHLGIKINGVYRDPRKIVS